MRIFKRLSGWLSAGIFALVLLVIALAAVPAAAGDTGTYGISDYIVTLEPQSSGQTRITYEQEWKVLSGHIPWVTVGLPNSNFSVEEFSGAAARVRAENAGSWTGIRADLDKDYRTGETFRISFTVLQGRLIEKLPEEEIWRIVFTPGWYDRAVTDHLEISLISPVELNTYSTLDPQPATTGDKVFIWERTNLAPGDKFTIRVECLDGGFLAADAETAGGGSNFGWLAIVGIVVVLALVGLVIYAVRQNRQAKATRLQYRIAQTEKEMEADRERKKEIEEGFEEYVEEKGLEPDSQGRYYDRSYGNYITPAIWAAVILHNQRNAASQDTPKGPSGCACACVACACACACACAGGGAAGCSRKTVHDCDAHSPDKIEEIYYVYIMTNKFHTVFDVGMTSDLHSRVYQYKENLFPGCTSRYNIEKLVYYEEIGVAPTAIAREKQLKASSRQEKIDLIQSLNPKWKDLYDDL